MNKSLMMPDPSNNHPWLVPYAGEVLNMKNLPSDLVNVDVDESDLQMIPGDIVELYAYAVKEFRIDPTNPRNQQELIRACAIMQKLNSSQDFMSLLLNPIREVMVSQFAGLSEMILNSIRNGDYPKNSDVELYIFYRKQLLSLRNGDEDAFTDALYDYYIGLTIDPTRAIYEEEIPFLEELFGVFNNEPTIPDLDFNEFSEQLVATLKSGNFPDELGIQLYIRCRRYIEDGSMEGNLNDALWGYFTLLSKERGEDEMPQFCFLERVFAA